MLGQRFLKKWMGIPTRGCTSLGVLDPHLLAIKPVSQVYLEGRLSSYINSTLVADIATQEALRCQEVREGAWVKKSNTIVQCKTIFSEMETEDDCFIPTKKNTSSFQATVQIEMSKIKKVAKLKVAKIF